MWFLYGELFILLLVSFAAGSLLATVALRFLVRTTVAQLETEAAPLSAEAGEPS